MKSTDTHCKTCGAHNKPPYIFLTIVLLLLVGSPLGGAWWYFAKKQKEEQVKHELLVSTYVDALKKLDFADDKANLIADLRYSKEMPTGDFGFSELKGQVVLFNDQRKLANSVMRVALAQPLSELQKIKRNTEEKKYSGCLEASKLIYVSSMEATNEALLAFLADGDSKEEDITYLFSKSIIQGKEADKLLLECESKKQG